MHSSSSDNLTGFCEVGYRVYGFVSYLFTRFPPYTEIYFNIDLKYSAKHISISPYRMALMDLKDQLQNLCRKRFIRDRVSP